MKNFDLNNQIQSWIDNKQLVQIHENEATEDFRVSQIIKLEDDYLTFSVIAIDGCYSKTSICHINDIQLFKVDTIYLTEFSRRVDCQKIYQQTIADLEGIKKFTPSGIFSAYQGKKTLITVAYSSGEEFTGRVIGLSESTLIIDEYGAEFDRRIARIYLKIEEITRIYLGDNNLRTTTLSLASKNI